MQLLKEGDTEITKHFTGDLLNFYTFHGVQLLGSNFPVKLIQQLHHKLTTQTYDVGDHFKIMDNQDESSFELHALKDIKKASDVWVLDHMMSFRYPELRKGLEENPQLLERVRQVTKYLNRKPNISALPIINEPESLDFDSKELSSIQDLKIPVNCVCLSLVDNKLSNQKQLIELIQRLQNLKVLWVMDNPLAESEGLKNYITNNTKIQLFNSTLTKNASSWILKYLSSEIKSIEKVSKTKDDQVFSVNLDDREVFNMSIDVISQLPNLHRISIKGTQANDKQSIQKLKQLLNIKSLAFVQCDLQLQTKIFQLYKQDNTSIPKDLLINDHNLYMSTPTQLSSQVDQIQNRIFKISNCYRLADSNRLDQTAIWYINDEVGSSITHSDLPQCVLSPFLFAPNNKMDDSVKAYTLMWLTKDVKEDQLIERDFLNGLKEDKQRSSRLAVWYNLPREIYINLYKQYTSNLQKISKQFNHKPIAKEFNPVIKQQFKVLTNSDLIKQFLTHPQFKITQNIDEADILWIDHDVKDNEEILKLTQKGVILNQFPHESCIVLKNNLANTIQSTLGETKFLQRTYNLETQLPIFLGHYFDNQEKGLDNLWISKPPNMARSMDMLVSNNLEILIRNMQTGPKLVQKYITYPVKRLNRKIDLRFIVAVKSIIPLNVYIYKHFWIRTSNNQYNIDCRFRQEYETHFTVMNYGKKLTQVMYPDFVSQFNKDYSPEEWATVYERIKQLLRQTFLSVQVRYPQMQSEVGRAVYGVDIMIDEKTMQPKLLQFTFSPDCNRACKFYPTFYNDLFQVMYLGKSNQNVEPLF